MPVTGGATATPPFSYVVVWDEIKDRLRKPALGLSVGQQRGATAARVCIARTIATGPKILLMDEPCSALDPNSTVGIEDLLSELRKQYTIFNVTLNMQQASRVSDMTAFFYQGNLVEYGLTPEIFTRPLQTRTEVYVTGKFGSSMAKSFDTVAFFLIHHRASRNNSLLSICDRAKQRV